MMKQKQNLRQIFGEIAARDRAGRDEGCRWRLEVFEEHLETVLLHYIIHDVVEVVQLMGLGSN